MKYSSSLPFLLLALSTLLSESSSAPQSFNVDAFGAKGDGVMDSTKAFEAAWKALCGAGAGAEMYVPKGNYVVQPVVFEGKCQCPKPTVRIDGSVLGPTDYMVISKAGRWIQFVEVENLVIQGGTLRGRGEYLFKCNSTQFHDPVCPFGGRMLSISNSNHVWINNLTSVNSQGFHVALEESQNVTILGATIVAPENSPNTDGIHIQNSTGVTITASSFQTGDDCISLGQGSQNVWIQNVVCGPGHGISIGSLAFEANELTVRNVTAKDVRFNGATNGFRIKTWAKPLPVTVHDIHFVNAVMTNVSNPIVIDQFYCPGGDCPLSQQQPSFAHISNVEFNNINGTSATMVAIRFDCSSKFPCTGLTLQDIKLKHSPQPAQSELKNAIVHTIGVVEPGVDRKPMKCFSVN